MSYVYMCFCCHVCSGVCKGQKVGGVESKLQVVVRHPLWALET